MGAHSLLAGVFGAHCNVLTNVKQLTDRALAGSLREEADTLLGRAREGCSSVDTITSSRL